MRIDTDVESAERIAPNFPSRIGLPELRLEPGLLLDAENGARQPVLPIVVAGILALDPESTVLGIVGNAWAGFGAAFGPAILFSLRWKRTTRQGVLAGMIVGALGVVAWILLGWSATLYEIVPGFIASSLAIWLVSRATPAPAAEIQSQFDEAAAAAKGA